MTRIADLELNPETTDEDRVDEKITDEQGRTAGEVIEDSFAEMLELADEEEDTESEQEDFEEEEEELDEQENSGDDAEEGEQPDEDDEEEEGEEGDEPEPTKDYASISEKLSGLYGEDEISTPEGVEAAIDELVKTRQDYERDKATFEQVTALFDESDEIVQIAKFMKEGYTVNEALARVIDFEKWQEELKENDPDEYKKVVKRQLEREQAQKQAQKEREEQEAAFNANKEESAKNWNEFKTAKKLDDKAAEKFSQQINNHFQSVASGKVTSEFLEVMYKGLAYEEDVKKAEEEGEKKGRNAKIEAERSKAKKKGDGLPKLRGGKTKTGQQKEDDDIFSVALKPRKRLADY